MEKKYLPAALQTRFALSSQPKGLLIDMDGTIANTLPMLFEAYSSFLRHFGQTGTSEEFYSLIGPSLLEIIALLKKRYFLECDIKDLLEIYSHGLADAYLHTVRAFPNVRETLTYAKTCGFKLALVSSAEREFVEACVAGLSLSSFFDVLISKKPELRSKPAPDLYLAALDSLHVNPRVAIAIEDAPSGVAAATKAGLFTLWITHGQAVSDNNFPGAGESYLYVENWKTILSLLKEIQCA